LDQYAAEGLELAYVGIMSACPLNTVSQMRSEAITGNPRVVSLVIPGIVLSFSTNLAVVSLTQRSDDKRVQHERMQTIECNLIEEE
jgi:hypothetical protein